MSDAPLARLENAHQLLAEARTMDEIKQVRDIAEAARLYAKEAKLGLEAQNYAAEIKLRAERRAGEVLATMRTTGDRASGYAPLKVESQPSTPPPTLADLGVTRDQSSRWQKIAALPEETFEHEIAVAKDANRELTTAGMLNVAAELTRQAAQLQDEAVGRAFSNIDDRHGDVERAELRAAYSSAKAAAFRFFLLKPDAVVPVLTMSERHELRLLLKRINTWIEDCEAAMSYGAPRLVEVSR